jgi:AcrR family transcriptional regulator
MKRSAKRSKVSSESRLTRDDWLDAAFKAVVDGGFDNARVLVIADKLGVTRGSFYWHFTDHPELVRALVDRWRAGETQTAQRVQQQASTDAEADLLRLLDVALARAGADLENVRFELALRVQARKDTQIAKLLAQVDQDRMALFENYFRRLVGDATEAHDLAALFYLTITGSWQALNRPSAPAQASEYLRGIIAKVLIHQQARQSQPAKTAARKRAATNST